MGNINVMKVGGAVLNRPENFILLLKILQNCSSTRTIFVFSAFSTISRKLKNIGFTAKTEGLELAMKKFEEVKNELLTLSKKILSEKNLSSGCLEKLNKLFEDLEKILFGISVTRELTNRTLDRLLSFGEHFSAVILEEFLKSNNIGAIFVDACDYIVTDSNYGNAKPIYEQTKRAIETRLIPLFAKANFIFIPGFIGCSELKTVTTMGFESSNLTALLIASIVQAQSVTFWTDVDGIQTSDPKIVDNTLPIPEISFEDAKVASLNGLKLIHPSMNKYFVENPNIKYIYKSAFAPDSKGTIILPQTNFQPQLILISEPYYLKEKTNEEENLCENYVLRVKSNDYEYCLVSDNNTQEQISSTFSIITLLNFETPKVLTSLEKIGKGFRFLYIDVVKKICKVIVPSSEVRDVANYLHNFLVLKK